MKNNLNIKRIFFLLIQLFLPIFLAFIISAILLYFLDSSAIEYYTYIFKRTLTNPLGFEAVLIRMTPLLCIGAGLMLAFRAGLWNLGIDGQFMLGAVFSAALAPYFAANPIILFISCMLVSFLIGALWGLIPIFLHIKQKSNEVIISLMMSFIGIGLANILVKYVFRDFSIPHPQTYLIAVENRLPRLFETSVHSGFLLAVLLVIAMHYFIKNTPLGLQLRILGANRKVAMHAGYKVHFLLYLAFLVSAGLIGLAGAIEVLGVYGQVQANWTPAYSMMVVPLIFLSRNNGFLLIFFAFLFSILIVGSESAARVLDIPSYINHITLALLMLFSALSDTILQYKKEDLC